MDFYFRSQNFISSIFCVLRNREHIPKKKKKKHRRTKNEKNFKSKGCENVMKKKRENRFIMSFYISIILVCVCDFNRSVYEHQFQSKM